MKTIAMTVLGLLLAVTLSGCGGEKSEADLEKDARSSINDLGLPKSMTDCAIKEIKKDAGSLEKFAELDTSEQSTVAAKAGSKCSEGLSQEDIGDVAGALEDQNVDLTNPAFRKSYITGMTTQGVPEDLANCIVDKAIDQDLKATDLVNAQTIQKLAASCS